MFESSKLPLTLWFMAMQLLSQGKNDVAALELRRQLDVSYPTAWLMKHKIMQAMRMAKLNRALHGWATYFQVGTVSQANRALDYYTARGCAEGLRIKHKARRRSGGTFGHGDRPLEFIQRLPALVPQPRVPTPRRQQCRGARPTAFRHPVRGVE